MAFTFQPLGIRDVVLVRPERHLDDRGFFKEVYREADFIAAGIDARFVQDNLTRSVRGALRGLHYQLPPGDQGKLIGVVHGEIFDVAVDIRRDSSTFGQWVGERLSADNFRQLWIPPGFAHGFCVTSERAQVQYKCTAVYAPECELAIAWDDPEIGIPWPVRDPILSDRDRAAPRLAEAGERLPRLGSGGGGP